MHRPILTSQIIKFMDQKYKKVSLRFSVLLCFSLVFFCVSLVLPCVVSAQQNISPRLSVSPHTFELDVFPGEVITEKIKISNKSEVALPIAAKVVDFSASDETGGMSFDEFSQDISFASRKWVEIEKPNFILDAGETEKVNFTISVPENAEPGGHYAVMLFEPRMPSFYFKEGQPRVVPVIGVLFLLSVKTFSLDPQEHKKLEVVEFSVPKEERLVMLENMTSKVLGSIVHTAATIEITKKSPSSFILRIRNNDIYHIKPFGTILIYNIFGKEIGEAEVSQKTILPGKIRQFPIKFSSQTPRYLKWLPEPIANFLAKNFFVGKYTAILDLKVKSPVAAGIAQFNIPTVLTFFSFPWKFWLSFIIALSFSLLFLAKYKKRIILSLKVLITRK